MKLIKSHVSNGCSVSPLSAEIHNALCLTKSSIFFVRNTRLTSQSQSSVCCSETDSASVGSDCHRRGGRVAHPHLLLLHNQKMLLQEEEEQEREEGQGWLQHEEHAGWRGMMPCASYMPKSQLNRMFWVIFCLFFSTTIYYSSFYILIYDIYTVFIH